jgi:hypothetical protein
MIKYRFKTKEEFIKEYGNKFHDRIHPTWNKLGFMDYLFGKILNNNENELLKNKDKISYDNMWFISKEMLVEIKEIPKYKKILNYD